MFERRQNDVPMSGRKGGSLYAEAISHRLGAKQIVSDITLAINPGEFICLMGPSGSGKSTLMDALNGRRPAQHGRVYLAGLDLFENFDSLRQLIGHVPQHDILHEGLTVRRTLQYAALLRLAKPTHKAVKEAVAQAILAVKLTEKATTRFRNLSGGEKKRLSIAVELLTEPDVLFLDEPTSPLDPRTSEDIIDILHEIARRGRTIITISHKFEKFASLDRVALLHDGHLVYFGPPARALAFFDCESDPSQIFNRLRVDGSDTLRSRFKQSDDYRRYVDDRVLQMQKDRTEHRATPRPALQKSVREWFVLTLRSLEIKWRDQLYSALLLLQAPIIAFALLLVGSGVTNDAKILFVSAVVAVWFGANNGIREIVGERPIFERENHHSRFTIPYVLSKAFVLAFIAAIQSWIFLWIVTYLGHLLRAADFWAVFGIFFLTACGSTAIALFLSAVAASMEQALTCLPLLLIPQLILSGFLKPVDDIYISSFTGKPIAAATYYDAQKQRNREPAAVRSTQQADMKVNGMGRAGWLTSLVIARWAMDGLVHEVSLGDDTARDRLAAEVSVSSYNAVIDGKSKARIANVYRNTLGLDALIIAAFCLLFLVLTVGALYYREAL